MTAAQGAAATAALPSEVALTATSTGSAVSAISALAVPNPAECATAPPFAAEPDEEIDEIPGPAVHGLPRILVRDRAELLIYLLGLRDPQDLKEWYQEMPLLNWAKEHGLTLKPSVELLCHCYGDRRFRELWFAVERDNEEHLRTPSRSDDRFDYSISLDWTILVDFFGEARKVPLDVEQLVATVADLKADQVPARLRAVIEQTEDYQSVWVIWLTLHSLLKGWPTLSEAKRLRAIIGVFLLVTVSNSLEPVRLAALRVPALAEEFADLRMVEPARYAQYIAQQKYDGAESYASASADAIAGATDLRQSHNIIGLPKLLLRSGASLLTDSLLARNRNERALLANQPRMQRWLKTRGGGRPPKLTVELMEECYGDLQLRHRWFVGSVDGIRHFNKTNWRKIISLDWTLALAYFKDLKIDRVLDFSKIEDSVAELERRHAVAEPMATLIANTPLAVRPIWQVWSKVHERLLTWSEIEVPERARAVIGLFVLATASRSLGPVRLAVLLEPKVAEEFAGLREVEIPVVSAAELANELELQKTLLPEETLAPLETPQLLALPAPAALPIIAPEQPAECEPSPTASCAQSEEMGPPKTVRIHGLPQILVKSGAALLFSMLGATTGRRRAALFTDLPVRDWARNHRLPVEHTTEFICRCYGDSEFRRTWLQLVARGVRDRPNVEASKRRASLEWTIIDEYFRKSAATEFDQKTILATVADLAPQVAAELSEAIAETSHKYRDLWSIWSAIDSLLRGWDKQPENHHQRCILGLFLLVTISNSLAPVRVAQLRAPALAAEFAEVRAMQMDSEELLTEMEAEAEAELEDAPAVERIEDLTPDPPLARPSNILGLPQRLKRDQCGRLLEILKCTGGPQRKRLAQNPMLRHWLQVNNWPSTVPDVAALEKCYSDRNVRYRWLNNYLTKASGRRDGSTQTVSLDYIASTRFFPERRLHRADLAELENTVAQLQASGAIQESIRSLIAHTPVAMRPLWSLWQLVHPLLLSWSTAGEADQERVVLALFVLVTVANSLGPVTIAQLIEPALRQEFADLREIYSAPAAELADQPPLTSPRRVRVSPPKVPDLLAPLINDPPPALPRARPLNVVGLPKWLSQESGRLWNLLKLNDAAGRAELVAQPLMQVWLAEHGSTDGQLTPALLEECYTDRNRRIDWFTTRRSPDMRKQIDQRIRVSLEWAILLGHFLALQGRRLDSRKVEETASTLEQADLVTDLVKKWLRSLIAQTSARHRPLWGVWNTIQPLFERWSKSQLPPKDHESVIFGLLLLVTISNSLGPVRVAQFWAPNLADEFAEVKEVYAQAAQAAQIADSAAGEGASEPAEIAVLPALVAPARPAEFPAALPDEPSEGTQPTAAVIESGALPVVAEPSAGTGENRRGTAHEPRLLRAGKLYPQLDDLDGLPNILVKNDWALLWQILRVTNRDQRQSILHQPLVRAWFENYGYSLKKAKPALIARCYGNLSLRNGWYQAVCSSRGAEPSESLSNLAGYSLEWQIIVRYFKEEFSEKFLADKLEGVAACVPPDRADDEVWDLIEQTPSIYRSVWRIWRQIYPLIPRWREWPEDHVERHRIILGLFVLTTVSRSFGLVSLAQAMEPEIGEEFAHLVPYYSCGEGAQQQERPAAIDTPKTIVGLPRVLSADDHLLFWGLLGANEKLSPKDLARRLPLRRFTEWRGLEPCKATVEVIQECYSDLLLRRRLFATVATGAQGDPHFTADAYWSLERRILWHYFGADYYLGLALDKYHAACAPFFDQAGEALQLLINATPERDRFVWQIWPRIFVLLEEWEMTAPAQKENAILGLWVLVTVTGSLQVLDIARAIAPGLAEEFADVTAVYESPPAIGAQASAGEVEVESPTASSSPSAAAVETSTSASGSGSARPTTQRVGGTNNILIQSHIIEGLEPEFVGPPEPLPPAQAARGTSLPAVAEAFLHSAPGDRGYPVHRANLFWGLIGRGQWLAAEQYIAAWGDEVTLSLPAGPLLRAAMLAGFVVTNSSVVTAQYRECLAKLNFQRLEEVLETQHSFGGYGLALAASLQPALFVPRSGALRLLRFSNRGWPAEWGQLLTEIATLGEQHLQITLEQCREFQAERQRQHRVQQLQDSMRSLSEYAHSRTSTQHQARAAWRDALAGDFGQVVDVILGKRSLSNESLQALLDHYGTREALEIWLASNGHSGTQLTPFYPQAETCLQAGAAWLDIQYSRHSGHVGYSVERINAVLQGLTTQLPTVLEFLQRQLTSVTSLEDEAGTRAALSALRSLQAVLEGQPTKEWESAELQDWLGLSGWTVVTIPKAQAVAEWARRDCEYESWVQRLGGAGELREAYALLYELQRIERWQGPPSADADAMVAERSADSVAREQLLGFTTRYRDELVPILTGEVARVRERLNELAVVSQVQNDYPIYHDLLTQLEGQIHADRYFDHAALLAQLAELAGLLEEGQQQALVIQAHDAGTETEIERAIAAVDVAAEKWPASETESGRGDTVLVEEHAGLNLPWEQIARANKATLETKDGPEGDSSAMVATRTPEGAQPADPSKQSWNTLGENVDAAQLRNFLEGITATSQGEGPLAPEGTEGKSAEPASEPVTQHSADTNNPALTEPQARSLWLTDELPLAELDQLVPPSALGKTWTAVTLVFGQRAAAALEAHFAAVRVHYRCCSILAEQASSLTHLRQLLADLPHSRQRILLHLELPAAQDDPGLYEEILELVYHQLARTPERIRVVVTLGSRAAWQWIAGGYTALESRWQTVRWPAPEGSGGEARVEQRLVDWGVTSFAPALSLLTDLVTHRLHDDCNLEWLQLLLAEKPLYCGMAAPAVALWGLRLGLWQRRDAERLRLEPLVVNDLSSYELVSNAVASSEDPSDWSYLFTERLWSSPALEWLLGVELALDGQPRPLGRRLMELCALFGRASKHREDRAGFFPKPKHFDVLALILYLQQVRAAVLAGESLPYGFATPAEWQPRDHVWVIGKAARLRQTLQRLTVQQRPVSEWMRYRWPVKRRGQYVLESVGAAELPGLCLLRPETLLQGLATEALAQAPPFAVVIDAATMAEGRQVGGLLNRLRHLGQGAPVLIVGDVGDKSTLLELRRRRMPCWLMRAGDVARMDAWAEAQDAARRAKILSGGALAGTELAGQRLAAGLQVEMEVLDGSEATRLFVPLLEGLHRFEEAAVDEIVLVSQVRNLARAILAHCVPWRLHIEAVVTGRSGRFATPSLETRLEVLRESTAATGMSQQALKTLVQRVEEVFTVLSRPNCVTPKQAALLRVTAQANRERRDLTVVCANAATQRAVRALLAQFGVDVIHGTVRVRTRAEIHRAWSQGTLADTELLLLEPLGFTAGAYFSGIASRLRFFAYAFEGAATEKQLHFIAHDTQVSSRLYGDKRALLVGRGLSDHSDHSGAEATKRFAQRRLRDSAVEPGPPRWRLRCTPVIEPGVLPGQLPEVQKTFDLETGWLQRVLSGMPETKRSRAAKADTEQENQTRVADGGNEETEDVESAEHLADADVDEDLDELDGAEVEARSEPSRRRTSARAMVQMELDDGDEPVLMYADTPVLLLGESAEETEGVILASDALAGMPIVVPRRAVGGQLLDRILSHCQGSADYEAAMPCLQMWREAVALLAKQTNHCAATALALLRDKGVGVTTVRAVQCWMLGLVLGPRDASSIQAVGEVTGRTDLVLNADLIHAAIAQIRYWRVMLAIKLLEYVRAGKSLGPDAMVDERLGLRRADLDELTRLGRIKRITRIPAGLGVAEALAQADAAQPALLESALQLPVAQAVLPPPLVERRPACIAEAVH